jgi:hypothetical protein
MGVSEEAATKSRGVLARNTVMLIAATVYEVNVASFQLNPTETSLSMGAFHTNGIEYTKNSSERITQSGVSASERLWHVWVEARRKLGLRDPDVARPGGPGDAHRC